MSLQCIIVDDEPLARKGLSEYVHDLPDLKLVGSFENAILAADFLKNNPVDLILLDIRMPRISGIEFLKNLKSPPLVIFTTAYPDYALESYELNVIDYLVKPIAFERFKKAVQKATDYAALRLHLSATQPDYFFIKCDHKLEKIEFQSLYLVEAMENYCILHIPGRKLITYITLTQMQHKLPADRFMKVHKSFLVALDKVKSVEGNHLLIGSLQVPISRSLKAEVLKRVLGNNLIKR